MDSLSPRLAPAWDVAIVGGGPSGISTALHLRAAAPGARIAVFEKARYPREKICAGGIGARAFRILERIGVEVACPHVVLDAVALRLASTTIVVRHRGCGAVVRRVEFDHAFARQAIDRGIPVLEGCAVEGLVIDERGAALTLADGTVHRARCVVGADGVAGAVRRLAGFPRGALRAQVVEIDTAAAPSDPPRDTAAFDFATPALRGYAWDFPTVVAGEPLMCRGVYALGVAADHPRARLTDYLAERGLAPERPIKQFAERGFEPGAEIARPRVLLVGEAAGIDIATGEGIGQAIEYGALAGGYLATALADSDLGFASWRRTVDRHHLGLQLRVRHLAYRAFYGPGRPTLERMLPRLGAVLRAGLDDFAGAPVSALGMIHGAGQFVAAALAASGPDRRG